MTPKKKNGNGIREITPGKFVATMYDSRAKGGTKHVGTFTVGDGPGQFPTRTAAKNAAQDAKREAEKLRDLQLKAPEVDESCASFALRWPRDYTEKRGVSTIEHNIDRLKAFIRDFGERSMCDIKPVEARAWIVGGIVPPQVRKLAKGWDNARTLPDGDVLVPAHRSNHAVVRAMFNDAVKTFRDEMPYGNPFADLRLTEPKGRAGDAITVLLEAELALLVDVAHEVYGDYGRHFGALIEAAAWTGVRPGEMWAIEIDEQTSKNYVDFKAGEVRIDWQIDKRNRTRPPKWNSKRHIFLLPPATSAFQRAIDVRPAGPVFLTKRDANRLTGRSLGYYWAPVRAAFWKELPPERQSKVLAKDGGPEPGKIAADFDFYELRHFFGTQLAEMGMTPAEIANQMGHKDGGQLALKRYIHPRSESTKRSMLERFEEHRRRQQQREETG